MNKKNLRTEITQSNEPHPAGKEKLVKKKQTDSEFIRVNETVRDLVFRWYLKPLGKLNHQHDGFAILILAFPLYEKHLKFFLGSMEFSENSPLVKQIGKDFKISTEQAYELWQIFRNGLLHLALPDATEMNYDWALSQDIDVPIKVKDATFIINPLLFKNKVIEIALSKLDMWKEKDFFPQRFRVLE